MGRPKFIPQHDPPSKDEINALRLRAGLTMAGMARLLDVSTAAVEAWAYGRTDMPSPIWRLFRIVVRPLIKKRGKPNL